MKKSWKRAVDDHRGMLIVAAVFSASVLTMALGYGVPLWNLAHIFGYILMSFLIGLVMLTGLYLISFVNFFHAAKGDVVKRWRKAGEKLDIAARQYLEGDRWRYACLAFCVTLSDNFFFISKSMVPVVNPYHKMKWDFVFMEWDKFAHGGLYPHQIIIPFVNGIGFEHVLDVTYALWMPVMFLTVGFNMFIDDVAHRRLRFLWVYLLSWILLGSLCAICLSSTGPLFFHDFYPTSPDPYSDLVANMDNLAKKSFFFATKTRQLLLQWTLNDRMFDPNTIAAMPSMHVAIAWLMMLYSRHVNKYLFWASIPFCVIVYMATVYFGIHYAADSFVSVPVVTLLWWGAGKVLDKRYSRSHKLSAGH